MDNNWTLIIIGLYTFIYVIVFIIQKSQIDKQKEITNSMKSFIDIFNIEKVKEYVELKHETNLMKIDKLIADDKTINEAMRNITTEKVDEIKKVYIDQMGKQHFEMTSVIVRVLKSIDEEERELFISEYLESCKHIFIPMLDDIEKNDI
jgi:hypothetical protein